MKVTIIWVGKTVVNEIEALTADYIKRIKRCSVTIKTIPNIKKNYPADIQKTEECKEILKHIKNDDFVVLLDDKGKSFTSLEFAAWIDKHQMNIKSMVFVIGGAYGFSAEMYDRANQKLSLSKMTFSHQIIRAIFAEQLYRAFSIIDNSPYHHE